MSEDSSSMSNGELFARAARARIAELERQRKSGYIRALLHHEAEKERLRKAEEMSEYSSSMSDGELFARAAVTPSPISHKVLLPCPFSGEVYGLFEVIEDTSLLETALRLSDALHNHLAGCLYGFDDPLAYDLHMDACQFSNATIQAGFDAAKNG